MSLKLKLTGTAITDYRNVSPAEADVVFPINQPHDPFPTGWTVAGTAPDRRLIAPDGSALVSEWDESSAALESDGGTRPFIDETETGIVVNRASGFVSEWETFDLIGPGVGYGHFAITAADADGEIWTQDPGGIIYGADFQVSANGIAWSAGYADSAFTPIGIFAFPPNPVGDTAAYVTVTPRYIRFRLQIIDATSGLVYAGANNPSLEHTLAYTAS